MTVQDVVSFDMQRSRSYRSNVCTLELPPGHRFPVPLGRGQMQGKIKGRGTPARGKSVCTWGGRGTGREVAPCRARQQGRVRIGEAACIVRVGALIFAGAAA